MRETHSDWVIGGERALSENIETDENLVDSGRGAGPERTRGWV